MRVYAFTVGNVGLSQRVLEAKTLRREACCCILMDFNICNWLAEPIIFLNL